MIVLRGPDRKTSDLSLVNVTFLDQDLIWERQEGSFARVLGSLVFNGTNNLSVITIEVEESTS